MNVQYHTELWDDSIKAIHARSIMEDLTQTEDDSYLQKEKGPIYTTCTSLQVEDTGVGVDEAQVQAIFS